MNTADVQLDQRLFCLFKGDPGSGKSIAAGSFPKPYFIDNDGRMKSVINFWRPRGKEFEYDRFDDFLTTNRRLEELYISCPFETIVYDGITTGADIILKTMIETRDAGAKKKLRGGIELLQIEDYGGEDRGLTTIINNLKALSFKWNINVIVTAHILTVEQTDITKKVTSVSRTLLTAGKKVAAKLPVNFDEAYHFDVQTSMDMANPAPKYTIVTSNTGWDWAKTALGLPLRIDFTDKSLYDEIMKSVLNKDSFAL
jgi:hypothetical protein